MSLSEAKRRNHKRLYRAYEEAGRPDWTNFHRRFAHLRTVGEWFKREADLAVFLARFERTTS